MPFVSFSKDVSYGLLSFSPWPEGWIVSVCVGLYAVVWNGVLGFAGFISTGWQAWEKKVMSKCRAWRKFWNLNFGQPEWRSSSFRETRHLLLRPSSFALYYGFFFRAPGQGTPACFRFIPFGGFQVVPFRLGCLSPRRTASTTRCLAIYTGRYCCSHCRPPNPPATRKQTWASYLTRVLVLFGASPWRLFVFSLTRVTCYLSSCSALYRIVSCRVVSGLEGSCPPSLILFLGFSLVLSCLLCARTFFDGGELLSLSVLCRFSRCFVHPRWIPSRNRETWRVFVG